MRIDVLIDELQEILDGAFTLPLSGGKTVVNAERLREVVEEIRTNLPGEVKQAKSIVADRTNILNKAREEAESIVQTAEERVRTMSQQSEIVRLAQEKAKGIIFNANNQAEQIKKAANDYIDNLMKKADEELSKNLSDLKKTRAGIQALQQKESAQNKAKKQ